MYFGAEHLIGFLTVCPSAQWYSYLGPADIIGQRSSVQNSVIVPYNMLIWLKKSTVLTATHSLRSSPSGSMTASLKFPDPRVAAACFIKSCWCVPSGMFFFGLNVLLDRLPLKGVKLEGRQENIQEVRRWRHSFEEWAVASESGCWNADCQITEWWDSKFEKAIRKLSRRVN